MVAERRTPNISEIDVMIWTECFTLFVRYIYVRREACIESIYEKMCDGQIFFFFCFRTIIIIIIKSKIEWPVWFEIKAPLIQLTVKFKTLVFYTAIKRTNGHTWTFDEILLDNLISGWSSKFDSNTNGKHNTECVDVIYKTKNYSKTKCCWWHFASGIETQYTLFLCWKVV